MRPFLLLIGFFVALVSTSCGPTVVLDYESGTNFSAFKSYGYFPSIDSGLSNLDEKRVMAYIDSLMPLKGITLQEEPQLYINFYGKEMMSQSRSSIGIGIGGGGGNVGVGVSGGIPIGGNEIDQRLTIDIIDSEKDQLIWQAVLNGTFKERSTPGQKELYYQKAVMKMLKNFPPNLK